MDRDDPPFQRSDGFVPDAPAGKLLATLPNDERVDILRTLESMKRKTDIRNPNAVLTALVTWRRTVRREGFVLDDGADGLLRELDDQARSNFSSYVNRVCKVVDACDTHVLLRVIIEVYTEQQQQQPPQSRSGEELATCRVNVPGFATGYGNPPKRVVEEGDVRSSGRGVSKAVCDAFPGIGRSNWTLSRRRGVATPTLIRGCTGGIFSGEKAGCWTRLSTRRVHCPTSAGGASYPVQPNCGSVFG